MVNILVKGVLVAKITMFDYLFVSVLASYFYIDNAFPYPEMVPFSAHIMDMYNFIFLVVAIFDLDDVWWLLL